MSKKRKTGDDVFKTLCIVNKKSRIDQYNYSILLTELSEDIIYYEICKYLNISHATKLLMVNKKMKQILSNTSFWAHRYITDFGKNKNTTFSNDEWKLMYKIVYLNIKELHTPVNKLIYCITNNHTSLTYKLLNNESFICSYYESRRIIKNIVKYGDFVLLKDFVKLVDLNLINRNLRFHIMLKGLNTAIKENKLYMVHMLFDKNIHTNNPYCDSLLHYATKKGNYDICDYLIKNCINVNQIYEEVTPLWHACNAGYTDIVKLLLKNGANTNVICEYNTLLSIVIGNGYNDILELLCLYGANVNFTGELIPPPLYVAVLGQNIEAVKVLLKYKANNSIKYMNWTPLYLAVRLGSLEMVKLLVSNGANLEIKNDDQELTALYASCIRGDAQIVNFLCESGANIYVKNKSGILLYYNPQINDKCRKVLDAFNIYS